MKWLPLLFFLLLGCQPETPPYLIRIEGIQMQIPYCIQVGGFSSLPEIERVISETFSEIDTIYNNWNPQSEISYFNQASAYKKIALSEKLLNFLKETEKLVLVTEGRFDPTACSSYAGIGWHHLHFDGDLLWKDEESTQLNLGGIAKGYAVDLLVERLEKLGCHNVYVEWGGEVRTIGQHPQKRPWRVEIYGGPVVELQQASMATSGNYLQQWSEGEITYTHIIDPLNKIPLHVRPTSISSATVLTEKCMEADAFATALMLFPDRMSAEQWAKERGLWVYLY